MGSQKVKYNLDAVPSETEMGIGREPSSPENQKHQNRSKPPREVSRVIRPLPTFYNSRTCRSVDVVNILLHSLFFLSTPRAKICWSSEFVCRLTPYTITSMYYPTHHITIKPLDPSAQSQALIITAGLKTSFGQCQVHRCKMN